MNQWDKHKGFDRQVCVLECGVSAENECGTLGSRLDVLN